MTCISYLVNSNITHIFTHAFAEAPPPPSRRRSFADAEYPKLSQRQYRCISQQSGWFAPSCLYLLSADFIIVLMCQVDWAVTRASSKEF